MSGLRRDMPDGTSRFSLDGKLTETHVVPALERRLSLVSTRIFGRGGYLSLAGGAKTHQLGP
jgi:hypothetical protein